ncbi:MAG: isoprenylcysteine carboxylmethyltransferase family protein [Bryobacteraceae bacterium]|nr:isoprenylcysteine carboxylmethyltransferase family protein [Bryobacteraceae bacterium]
MRFPKPWADVVARLRVPSGFVLAASFALLARPTRESLLWSLPLSVAGLALRGWAAGHLAKNQQLAVGGPYSYIRNPLYAGTLLVAAGLVLAAQRWELAGVFALVFALVYLPVIQNEEDHLRKIFPEYSAYANRVPLLFPRIRLLRTEARWQQALYLRNEEYNALLGYLAGLGWLIWRVSP